MPTNFSTGVLSRGVPTESGDLLTGGNIYWVDSGHANTSDGNAGTRRDQPLATIAQAVSNTTASNGDFILVAEGHAETITAKVDVSVIGVTIRGLGRGTLRPSITGNVGDDTFDLSAANCRIEGLHFNEATSVTGGAINVSAAYCEIVDCRFDCGANDLESITVTATGDNLLIDGCEFNVTANGPDAAIEIEAAGCDRITIQNNIFNGGSDSNAWDVGAINSGVANTAALVRNNQSVFGAFCIFSSTATGNISDNRMGEGTLGSMLDPGSCMCFRNLEADAVDQKAREFPTTEAS